MGGQARLSACASRAGAAIFGRVEGCAPTRLPVDSAARPLGSAPVVLSPVIDSRPCGNARSWQPLDRGRTFSFDLWLLGLAPFTTRRGARIVW